MTGAWAWAELSLYEVAGAWVASSLRPSAKIYFDACSQHHAWRAQLWQQLLPAQVLPFGATRCWAWSGRSQCSCHLHGGPGNRGGEAVLGRGPGNDGRAQPPGYGHRAPGCILQGGVASRHCWLPLLATTVRRIFRPAGRQGAGLRLGRCGQRLGTGHRPCASVYGCPWRGGRGGLCCSGVEPGGATACGPRPGPGRLAASSGGQYRRPVPVASTGGRRQCPYWHRGLAPLARTLAFRGRGSYGVFHVQKTPDRCRDRRVRFLRC